MKTLFVALVALLFAFFLGCQSSVTDPEIAENTNFSGSTDENTITYKDAFNFKYPNRISLAATLLDPSHKLNSFADIFGVVRYGVRDFRGGQVVLNTPEFYKTAPTGTSDKQFKIDIFVDAEFRGAHYNPEHPWKVKDAAEQVVTVNAANQSVIYITKTFRVKDTCCAPLDFWIKFEFNGKKLEVVSMELKLVSGLCPIIDQE